MLRVETETGEAHLIVRAIGEIDLGTAALLSDQLTEASQAVPSGGALVLDLASVDFIGSAGLAVLLDHHQRLDAPRLRPHRNGQVPGGARINRRRPRRLTGMPVESSLQGLRRAA